MYSSLIGSFGKRSFLLPTLSFVDRFTSPTEYTTVDEMMIDFDSYSVNVCNQTLHLDEFLNFLHQVWYLQTRPRPRPSNMKLEWEIGYPHSYFTHGKLVVFGQEWDFYGFVGWYERLITEIVHCTQPKSQHDQKAIGAHRWYESLLSETQGIKK